MTIKFRFNRLVVKNLKTAVNMARTREKKSSGLGELLARIIAPPRFAEDEKNRLARILNIILLYGLLASVAGGSGHRGRRPIS